MLASQRPPQYVAIAFDNCNEPEIWKQTLDFSNELKSKKIEAHFTFFLSGSFFITEKNKKKYSSPSFLPCIKKCPDMKPDCDRKCHGPGSTSIGWAKDLNYLESRINQINLALKDGHEMGSHAVSHWNGSSWTNSEWQTEIDSFINLISDPGKFNEAPANFVKLNLKPENIFGFRAPYLSTNKEMYNIISKKFSYDTSSASNMNLWPQKNNFGTWIFPLGELPVRGRNRKVLSMDYNFYYMQSNALEEKNAELIKSYEDEMVDTYLNYFYSNYYGNRAPVHIGHHFTQYQSGAYWKALKLFTEEVCGKPEVKCVTYHELQNELDKISSSEIQSYNNKNFSLLKKNEVSKFNIFHLDERVPASVTREEMLQHVCPLEIKH